MQQPETNDGRPTVARRCAGLEATVMLTCVDVEDQTDRRHEPVDQGMTGLDRAAHRKPSQRL